MNKKVLIIAHQFPPMAGSGIQRTLKFVRYMPEFGFTPVVVTRDTESLELRDDSNMADIPEGTAVYRLPAHDLTAWPGIFGKYFGKFICRKLMIPDGERLWQKKGLRQVLDIVEKEKPDALYTTSYPYSDHLMGLEIKKRFPKLRWTADFRDEWSNNPYHVYGKLRGGIERSMERKVLFGADSLITNTPVMLKNFLGDNPELEDRFSVIPNGYDEADYASLDLTPPNNRRFTITYTGLLYGRRSPTTFLTALALLVVSKKLPRDMIRVNLIGNYKTDELNAEIKSFVLDDVVVLHPYMKHSECLAELARSDVLLIIEGNGPGAEAFYTGKVFEYINMNRPILGVVPEKGACADMIRMTRTGLTADFDDIEGIQNQIMKLYNGWQRRDMVFRPDRMTISRYTRRNLTEQLCKLL